MATGKKISKFTEATIPLTGDEYVDMLQNGGNVKTKISNLYSFISGLGFEDVGDYASISESTAARLILVAVDENNNDNTSLYLYTGSTLIFLLTIMP